MAGKPQIDWPPDGEFLALVAERGQYATARWLNVSRSAVKHRVQKIKKGGSAPTPTPAAGGVQVSAETVVVTTPAAENQKLGDYGVMLRERGLDPNDWVVVTAKANEWDAMTSDKATGDNRIVRMRQWTVTLKPHPRRVLIMPAVHVPPVKRTRVGPPPSDRPELILVEGDHQVPFQDPALHEASVAMLKELARKHRLAEQVYLGDTMDFATISRHDDHPSNMVESARPNPTIQGGYNLLREKREAAPNIRVRKLKGNHDWRIDGEQLKRAERMYGIAPAQEWESLEPEIPALHLRRLLHLDKLGIELVEDPRGWQHAEVELVAGMRGLVVRHGWLTGAKTAEASVKARGRSIIVGHIHRREHAYVWDPSAEVERQGVVAGTMSLVRNQRYPHYTTLDRWLQGCVIVTRWLDGDFQIEHARWNGETLRWRDCSWRG